MRRRTAAGLRFPTIPHLAGSASDPGDVVLSPAETQRFLSAPVRVTEKYDGLNVGLCFTPSLALRFVSRSHGLLAPAQLGPGLWPLMDFGFTHVAALLEILGTHSVLFGEWLEGPRRLPYPARATPFVGFDLYARARGRFLPGAEVERRLDAVGLTPARVRAEGRFASVSELLAQVPRSSLGGAAEGVVVERPDGLRAKVVRAAWARRPLWREAPLPPEASQRGLSPASHFTKRFPPERLADAAREVALLRVAGPRGVSPRLVRRASDAAGLTVVMTRAPGRPFPRRASPEVAAALGRQLARLHAASSRVQEALASLPADPLLHARARWLRAAPVAAPLNADRLAFDVSAEAGARFHSLRAQRPGRGSGALAARHDDLDGAATAEEAWVRFLRAQRPGQAPGGLVACHGDLKPENLRVRHGAVLLLDFERACLADRAWELACAMDRLGLDLAARHALLRAYVQAARLKDPGLPVRVHAYRLAWQRTLPRAVAAFEAETGRRPSTTARRLAVEAQRAAARLASALWHARRR